MILKGLPLISHLNSSEVRFPSDTFSMSSSASAITAAILPPDR